MARLFFMGVTDERASEARRLKFSCPIEALNQTRDRELRKVSGDRFK